MKNPLILKISSFDFFQSEAIYIVSMIFIYFSMDNFCVSILLDIFYLSFQLIQFMSKIWYR